MKKWSIIMVIVMVLLVITVSPLSALAQTGEDPEGASRPILRDGLAIVAPLATAVNTQISITVFQCSDQEPVEGAGVWLVTKEKAEILKQEIAANKENGGANADAAE